MLVIELDFTATVRESSWSMMILQLANAWHEKCGCKANAKNRFPSAEGEAEWWDVPASLQKRDHEANFWKLGKRSAR